MGQTGLYDNVVEFTENVEAADTDFNTITEVLPDVDFHSSKDSIVEEEG